MLEQVLAGWSRLEYVRAGTSRLEQIRSSFERELEQVDAGQNMCKLNLLKKQTGPKKEIEYTFQIYDPSVAD